MIHEQEGNRAMSKTMVMVCGHGSRDVDAIGEFETLTQGIFFL